MVAYFKIEIFAYDLFQTVWLKGGLISRKYPASEMYKTKYLTDDDYQEICDKLFYDAVLCRRILFQRLYMKEIMKEKDRYWDSAIDFYEYVKSTCKRHDWFGCLTVFERMFATCAFVLNLCFYNRENGNVDILKFGHLCWATYFDDFTDEFYEQGGWSQLKSVANSYTSLLRFLQVSWNDPDKALTEITKAIKNYKRLAHTSITHEHETVTKLWVKYQIQYLNTSCNNPIESASYDSCTYAEHILNELKHLCNPCDLEVLRFDADCSERPVFDSDSFYIPLTPTSSEENTDLENSISVFSEGNGEDLLSSSSLDNGESILEFETDDSDFTNQSGLNDLEETTFSSSCDDVSSDCLDISEHSIEFESICIISNCDQDQDLSRSMAKMQLNHDSLKLEETTIYDTELSSSTNDTNSIGQHLPRNTSDKNSVAQEMMLKECQILDDSSEFVEIVSKDTLPKVLSVTEGNSSYNNDNFKKSDIAHVTAFPNTVSSYDHQTSVSINEWDENDLVKNVSTPYKTKFMNQEVIT